MGVHQKIDRIARRNLRALLPNNQAFPTSHQILHFEGNNGPDGIKRKSPSKDEPWHYINPLKPNDRVLINLMLDHEYNLVQALKNQNDERAAFEAAWLAHAIVDGMTPAHHYPLNDKIEELWGKPHYERLTIKEKNIIKGINRRDTFSKNWQYWGFGGVFTAHLSYELGVASTISTKSFTSSGPSQADIDEFMRDGLEIVFLRNMHAIDSLKLYDSFVKDGWTNHMADQTNNVLIPQIIKLVTLAWYGAFLQSSRETL